MTGGWLTLSEAARRISEATGRPVSMDDVIRLGEQRRLTVRFQHGYHSVLEDSVSELGAHEGDVLAENAKPAWAPWSDPDYRREQADYDDTPNDEGDEQ